MKLTTLENLYMYGGAGAFYIFLDGVNSTSTIALGCLACFSFLPGYPALSEGSTLVSKKYLALNFAIGVVFLILMNALLDDKKTNEMCILFLCAYVACKAFRLATVRLMTAYIRR